MTTIALDGTIYASTPDTWTGFVASFSEFCAGVRDGREVESRHRMSQPDPAETSRFEIYRAALLGRPV